MFRGRLSRAGDRLEASEQRNSAGKQSNAQVQRKRTIAICQVYFVLCACRYFRGSVLEIANITKRDRGMYYCAAGNGVRQSIRRQIAVEVQFSPIVKVSKGRLAQARRYDVDLECRVEAYPPPAIVWLKDGKYISNSQHYRWVYLLIFFLLARYSNYIQT